MFGRWGRFVYRHRLATLIGSGAVLVASVVFLIMGGTLTSGGPLTSNLEAARAGKLVSSDLGHKTTTVPKTSSFDLIFKSGTLPVGDTSFKDAVTTALAPIQSDPRIVSLLTPYNVPSPDAAQSLTSKDGREALVIVEINATGQKAWSVYSDLRSKVRSGTLTVTGTGFVPVNQAFNATLESDLQRAEYVTLPLTLLLLVLIFASVIAAGLPLGIGILTIVGAGQTLCIMTYAPALVWKKSEEARALLDAVVGSITFR